MLHLHACSKTTLTVLLLLVVVLPSNVALGSCMIQCRTGYICNVSVHSVASCLVQNFLNNGQSFSSRISIFLISQFYVGVWGLGEFGVGPLYRRSAVYIVRVCSLRDRLVSRSQLAPLTLEKNSYKNSSKFASEKAE